MPKDIRLLALDIDDTLVDRSSILPQRTKNALSAAAKKGVKVVLATGRGYLGTAAIRKQLAAPLEYIICFGGALIADFATGKPFIEEAMAPDDVKKSIAIGYALNLHVQIYQRGLVVFPSLDDFGKQYTDRQQLPYEVRPDMLNGDLKDVMKVLCYAPPGREEECYALVNKQLPDNLHALTSKSGFIEIGQKSVTKGSALALLSKRLQIPRENTAAIGDNTLDLDMIQWAGLGCCVANGRESVKEAADLVLPSQQEEGAAQFIEDYIL